MRPVIALSLALCLTTGSVGCTFSAPWTKRDKALLAASTLATAADIATTIQGRHRGLEEMSPILGSQPSSLKIIAVGALAQGLAIAVAHALPQLRPWLLGAKTLFNGASAARNYNLSHE